MPFRLLRRSLLPAVLLGLAAVHPAAASGIAFRLIIGAPPDPNYQEVSYDGNAGLPPRGFSPGYGYPSDYMKLPSLVITSERPGPMVPDAVLAGPDVPTTAVLVRVLVPPEARVWFSGEPTAQQGGARLFVTPPLADGKALTYDVRAAWQQNGKVMERTRRVEVHPGDRITVDFLTTGGDDAEALPAPRRVTQP